MALFIPGWSHCALCNCVINDEGDSSIGFPDNINIYGMPGTECPVLSDANVHAGCFARWGKCDEFIRHINASLKRRARYGATLEEGQALELSRGGWIESRTLLS